MKYKLFIAVAVLFAACKGGTGKTEEKQDTTLQIENKGGTNIDSSNESGSRLIAANDCLTCHYVDKKGFGPSYAQIANRYGDNQGNVENLADKIIKGGKGLWGQNAMTPHPHVSEPQAQEMARYVLSLRNTSDTTK